MIIDSITGVKLIPGRKGKRCPGNGELTFDEDNFPICCCDECSYGWCCSDFHRFYECLICTDEECLNSLFNKLFRRK